MAGRSAPAALAQRDLELRHAVWLGVAIAAVSVGADLVDGSLGAITSYGVGMASVTVPAAVWHDQLWSTIFVPPLLLLGVMTVVALTVPAAIDPAGMPDSAGRAARVLAGTVDRGVTLAVAEAVTLAVIGLRRLSRRA